MYKVASNSFASRFLEHLPAGQHMCIAVICTGSVKAAAIVLELCSPQNDTSATDSTPTERPEPAETFGNVQVYQLGHERLNAQITLLCIEDLDMFHPISGHRSRKLWQQVELVCQLTVLSRLRARLSSKSKVATIVWFCVTQTTAESRQPELMQAFRRCSAVLPTIVVTVDAVSNPTHVIQEYLEENIPVRAVIAVNTTRKVLRIPNELVIPRFGFQNVINSTIRIVESTPAVLSTEPTWLAGQTALAARAWKFLVLTAAVGPIIAHRLCHRRTIAVPAAFLVLSAVWFAFSMTQTPHSFSGVSDTEPNKP